MRMDHLLDAAASWRVSLGCNQRVALLNPDAGEAFA
jgi:hypothetical protein